MRDQQSSRSSQLLRVGQVGVKALIREPVKEAVQEALAEEGVLAEKQTPAEDREEPADGTEETEQAEGETDSGNRILRPAVLLPILGLAVAVAVVKRRRVLELAEEKGVVDGGDETDSPHDSSQGTTADSDSTDTEDSTDTKYSTSPDAYDGDTDHDESTGTKDRDGSIEHEDYNGDTEGLSKTE